MVNKGNQLQIGYSSLIGVRFWIVATLAALGGGLVLAEALIALDAFENFYEFTRAHESWNMDEWALAGMATLISVALVSSAVIYLLTKRLIGKEAERQLADLRLKEAQHLVALGTMVAGTAHSINNHLMPVIALTDLVRSELPKESGHARDLEKVLMAARSTAEIVTRMKTFAKTNHQIKGVCPVESATRSAIEFAKIGAPDSAVIKVSLATTAAKIGVSAAAWEIVVLNLINNAVDALEGASGEITISLGHKGTPKWAGPGAMAAQSQWIQLQVSDNGKGMGEEERDRIFEPFFTTKAVGKGTGLGMPESYGIVDNAGGKIEVTSTLGKGSTLTVWVPIVDGAAASRA